jgi:hypothetical protein
MILSDAEAAYYRRDNNRELRFTVAWRVVNNHRNSRLCWDCPEPGSGLPCPQLVTWWPIYCEMGQP